MIMPNFLIIGTQKAGTSALNSYLKAHPQIYMSPIKEPGFFDFMGERVNFCGLGDSQAYRFAITDLSAYKNLFQGVKDEIAVGESTTWYLQSSKAPERIKQYIPHAKLIVILRNPVERAYSAFVHALRDEVEPVKNFSLALLEEERRVSSNWGFLWRYQHMGFYAKQLKHYYQHFERDRIRVYLYEDFNDDPQKILQDIFQFLNVDVNFTPDLYARHNISGVAKSKSLDTFLYHENHPVKEFIKPLIPNEIRKQFVNYIKVRNRAKPKLFEKDRTQLIKVFRNDIQELETLIQRDLSTWLK